MHKTLSLLASLQLATPTTFKGLSIQPLLDHHANAVDWLALDEALADGSALVTEISEGGSVPELFFDNRGKHPVLLMDGEELVGAKQNRILNASILVGAATRTRIPVSCVEQGRWSWRSRHFGTSDRVLYSSARQGKMAQVAESLAYDGKFAANQGEIWADISRKSERMGVHSPTGAAAALYEQRASDLTALVGAFKPVDAQVGAAFFLDGRFSGLDLVGCPRLFARLLPKLVRSYALDLLDQRLSRRHTADDNAANDPAPGLTPDFLAHLGSTPGTARPSVGLGQDIRFANPTVIGAALLVDERLAQLSVFPAGAAA
jgi:hypothetical protein